jgi:hypothetical protein
MVTLIRPPPPALPAALVSANRAFDLLEQGLAGM